MQKHIPVCLCSALTHFWLIAGQAPVGLDVWALEPSVPGQGLCVLGQQMDVKCSTPSFLTASIQALGSGDKAALQTFERLCIEVLPPGASGGPVCQHTPALGHDPGADLGPTGDQTSREDEGPFRIHSIPLGSLTWVNKPVLSKNVKIVKDLTHYTPMTLIWQQSLLVLWGVFIQILISK